MHVQDLVVVFLSVVYLIQAAFRGLNFAGGNESKNSKTESKPKVENSRLNPLFLHLTSFIYCYAMFNVATCALIMQKYVLHQRQICEYRYGIKIPLLVLLKLLILLWWSQSRWRIGSTGCWLWPSLLVNMMLWYFLDVFADSVHMIVSFVSNQHKAREHISPYWLCNKSGRKFQNSPLYTFSFVYTPVRTKQAWCDRWFSLLAVGARKHS